MPCQFGWKDAGRRARAPRGEAADMMRDAIGQRHRDEIIGFHPARDQPTRAGCATGIEFGPAHRFRSEEHTSELQSLMRISYAVFCLKKKTISNQPLPNQYTPPQQAT